jgi:sterol desaturase/sphingolipid hydroxylase (fatty acid hydroxylase superfamily)
VKAAIWTVCEGLYKRGRCLLYAADDPFSPLHLFYMAGCVLVLDYLHDTWFYWTHRLLHWKPLYMHVHYIHHKYGHPNQLIGSSSRSLKLQAPPYVGVVVLEHSCLVSRRSMAITRQYSATTSIQRSWLHSHDIPLRLAFCPFCLSFLLPLLSFLPGIHYDQGVSFARQPCKAPLSYA